MAERLRLISFNVRQKGERVAAQGSSIVLIVYIEKRALGLCQYNGNTLMESELLVLRNWHTVGRWAGDLAASPNTGTGMVIGEK